MINKLVNYFRGYLCIRVSGYTVERFVNICSSKGIALWNIEVTDNGYQMNIFIKDFKKLKPVIRKTNTKVVIVKRTGFPFCIHVYRNRRAFFIGIILCVILIQFMAAHVWAIKVSGNSTYTTEMILEYLEQQNIKSGVWRNEVNCKNIASAMREHFDDIIWVSASLDGANLIIKVKENEDSWKDIPEYTDKTPYDIISDAQCQITKLVIRKGISLVKEGDYLEKGDILVSGQIPVCNDSNEIIGYSYCVSDADIYGKVILSYNDMIMRRYQKKVYSDIEKINYFLTIGKYRFILGDKNRYDHFIKYSAYHTMGLFHFGKTTFSHYHLEEKNYTDQELEKLLTLNFRYYCKELEKKGVVILKNNVKIYTWSDRAKAKGTITVEMPVGQLEKSQIKEIGDSIDGNDGDNN